MDYSTRTTGEMHTPLTMQPVRQDNSFFSSLSSRVNKLFEDRANRNAALMSVCSLGPLSLCVATKYLQPVPVSAVLLCTIVTVASLWAFFTYAKPLLEDNELEILRDDLKRNPLKILSIVNKKFDEHPNIDYLKIFFENERGEDVGGISRQFITDLFLGVAEELSFTKCKNGFFRPCEPRSSSEEMAYQKLGRLMLFCLNSSEEYPIGPIFDEGVYAGIQAFPDILLGVPFSQIKQDEKNLEVLFSVYEAMNFHDESSILDMKQALEPWNEHTSERRIETIYEIIEEDLPQELRGLSVVAEIKKQDDIIKNTLKKRYMNVLASSVAPIHALACGMKNASFQSPKSWNQLKEITPFAFQELLQGNSDCKTILQKIVFDEKVPHEKQRWVETWINTSDEKTLQNFLYAVTGARSLSQEKISISTSGGEIVSFHTCGQTLIFPFGKVSNEEEFKATIEAAISGKMNFTIR